MFWAKALVCAGYNCYMNDAIMLQMASFAKTVRIFSNTRNSYAAYVIKNYQIPGDDLGTYFSILYLHTNYRYFDENSRVLD